MAETAAAPAQAADDAYTLMIVDDSNLIRRQIERMTRTERLRVIGTAGNGEDAVRMFGELRPDLVTMDITMPNMDGVTALKAIRGNDATARIIMCSAMGQESLVVEAITSGARDFVAKPFEADRVVEAVNKALA